MPLELHGWDFRQAHASSTLWAARCDHRRRGPRAGGGPAPAIARPCASAAWARGRQLPPRGLRPDGLRGEAATIQDHYLAGDKKAASAAVPTAMAGDVTLIGSWAGIAGEIQWWQRPSPPRSASTAACVTGVKSPASCGADAGVVQCCGALT